MHTLSICTLACGQVGMATGILKWTVTRKAVGQFSVLPKAMLASNIQYSHNTSLTVLVGS